MSLQAYHTKNTLEAGCDEAGRGCLAGPVFAAAVILPPRVRLPKLDDSKKLTEKVRYELRPLIEQKAIAWAVGYLTPAEIDEFNILRGSFMAMHRAIDQLTTTPESLLIDGNRFLPYQNTIHHCIIKGDSKFRSIAAASVLAKTYRDDWMKKLAQEHPEYGWERNMGYPTKAHRAAIAKHGSTPHHRMSFRLLPDQLEMKF